MAVHVFGSLNVDQVAYVQRLPESSETIKGESKQFAGGKGLNQAVAAARAGAKVYMLGAVGHDAGGGFLRAFLSSEQIEATALITMDAPSGLALITVDRKGENAIVVCAGANGLAQAPKASEPAAQKIQAGDVCLAQRDEPS